MTRVVNVTSFAAVEPSPPAEVPPNPADRNAVYYCDAPGCGRAADTLHLIGRRPVVADTTLVVLACPGHDPEGIYYELAAWLEPFSEVRKHLHRKIGGPAAVALVDARLTGGAA